MRIRAVSVLLSVLALIVGVGVAASAHPSTDYPHVVIAMDDVPYGDILLTRGKHILFRNDGSNQEPHTFSVCGKDASGRLTACSLDSGPVWPGQERLLETKGIPGGENRPLVCRIHPDTMQGTLTIQPSLD